MLTNADGRRKPPPQAIIASGGRSWERLPDAAAALGGPGAGPHDNVNKVVQRTGRSAFLIATGILCSRLAGLVRLRVFAYYFGLESDSADAFNVAFRVPNFL